ncbi:MAG TPA: 4'-phosphopantetheinyl transferase superfamily protein [Actinotalea sp.]|nr:4'-phosphopantetheinyl transferase superfamily protein [Actinotalea sp.]
MRQDSVAVPTVEVTTVDVWLLDPLGLEPAGLHHLLDAAERDRAAALPSPAAARFVLARALLRGVLGTRLGRPAADVRLRARCPRCGGPHGRVVVGSDGPPLHVSLSRSGPLIAVVLCRSGPVGVDVESRDAVARARLADVVLSPTELVAHHRLAPADRAAALARAWVRKEAVLKALGTGLRLAPGAVEVHGDQVTTDPASVGADLALTGGDLSLADLPLDGDAVGAVAVLLPTGGLDRPGRTDRGHAPAARVVLHDGAPVVRAAAAG